MSLFGRQPGQARYSGELHNLQITESVYATSVPVVFGTARVHGKLIFYGGFYATNAPSAGKGLFGGKDDLYDYYADVLILLASGCYSESIGGILNLWDQNGKLYNESGSYTYTVPSGGGTVQPTGNNPPIQQDFGATKATSYNVVATDYGAGGTRTLTGTMQTPMTKVTGTPGAGQYSFNPATSAYTFSAADAGATVTIQYSSVFSLYYFEETQAAQIPATSPYTVSTDNQSYFQADLGVTFVDTGVALTKVPAGTTPSAGQYNEDVGFYTFAAADAGRYVYIDYEYYSSDPDLTNTSSQNLTVFAGTQSQAPWSYMTSKYPGDALGFSTICYAGANPMYLGESATLPSYNYEIVGLGVSPGQWDADATVAISLLLTDPFIGVGFPGSALASLTALQQYWNSNGFFISQYINSPQSAAQTISRWLEAGNAAAYFSEGQLKIVPYGDTTSVGNGFVFHPGTTPQIPQLTMDNILPWQDEHGKNTSEDPIQYQRKQPQDRYNFMQVQWTNRANDYNNDLMFARNDAFIAQYGRRIEPSQTWDFLTTQAAVSWALQLRMNRALYIPETGKFRLPFTFAYIEPMDVIELPTGESVRVTGVDEDEEGALTISFENFTYGSADATIYTKQAPTSYQPNVSQALPGNAVPVFVQNTTVQTSGILNRLQIAASGQTQNWGGCNVYVSIDGDTYTQLPNSVAAPGVIGLLSAALPAGPDPDTTDTLSVDITLSQLANPSAELVTVTSAQANNFVTLCALVSPTGDTMELISYETATLTADGRYNLTNLRRGVYGTAIEAWPVGSWFAFLGPNYKFLDYQYNPQYIGQTLYVKLQSYNLAGNQLQNLSQCKAWQLFVGNTGATYNPLFKPTANAVTYNNLDSGTSSATNPQDAYDGNTTTAAILEATGGSTGQGQVNVTYSGFGTGTNTTPTALELYFSMLFQPSSFTSFACSCTVTMGGTGETFFNYQPATTETPSGLVTFTVPIPAGTELSTITVEISLTSTDSTTPSYAYIYEMWIGQPQ